MECVGRSLKRKFSSFDSQKTSNITLDVPWTERFSPRSVDELCVHKKKIQEVEAWFQFCFSQTGKQKNALLLLITGPPGSGKTMTVKMLCKSMKKELFVWANTRQESKNQGYLDDMFNINQNLWIERESQAASFSRFLFQSTKYSLFSDQKRVILIEEFPNAFLRDPPQFHNILKKYSVNSRNPVVFIVSDSARSENFENKLFPKDLIFSLKITNISFNPVAPTMLMKTLNRINNSIMNESSCRKLTKNELEAISTDSMGDIRNAVNSLQFLCISKVCGKELKKINSESSKSKSALMKSKDNKRDGSLFLFHSLGKILYCKRDASLKSENDVLPEHIKHLERDPLVAIPEEVFERTSISGDSFALFLQENYIPFVTDISVASECSYWLSEGDVLSSYWNEKNIMGDYLVSLVARGMMFSLEKSITGHRFRPLHTPQYFERIKQANKIKDSMKNVFQAQSLNLNELQTEYVPFCSKLESSNFTIEQILLLKELGEMKIKRISRLDFKSLQEKDVIDYSIDVRDLSTESSNEKCDIDQQPSNDDDVVIEEYDF